MGISFWVTEGVYGGGSGELKGVHLEVFGERESPPTPSQINYATFDFGKLVKYLILIMHD